MNTQKRKAWVALLSVASNSLLVALKLVVGLTIGSVSVISEGIHSGVDLLAAVIAFFAVRTSGKPADRDHPYGHEKVENVSGTIEALLIFLAAGWIIYEAVRKLIKHEGPESVAWGIGIMLLSVVLNIIVSRMLFKVGRATHSAALLADAWHLATDVWTSAGVMAGLALLWLGQVLFPDVDLYWIDPVAAMMVAILIIRAAYHLTVQAGRDLLDVALPQEEIDWIKAYMRGMRGRIGGFHDLRTRKAGHRRFIDCHVELPYNMSVDKSHQIVDEIEDAIKKHFAHSDVTIHVEPCQMCKPALPESVSGDGQAEGDVIPPDVGRS